MVVFQQFWLFFIYVKYFIEMVVMVYNFLLGIWYIVFVSQYFLKMYILVLVGGFLCLVLYFNCFVVVCVCNFLIIQWKDFFSMFYIKCVYFLGMVVDKVIWYYKIVVVGIQLWQDLVFNMEVYDFVIGVWEIIGRVLGFFISYCLVYCNGLFYNFLVIRGWFVMLILYVYDIEQQFWREEICFVMLLNF